ncbi:hypothetical protein D0X99_01890 [Algoriphagus lacus]|uniref:Peptidase S8/S53 domain-containing protein n=1 Tax=Algoriphagus lacus TaxID=2056311 RepID=A0A418PWL4_9BACT|nr:S8 family serine peptidase [Algoriphagus lacus]RIW18463.1 hypothetical protein D0X99_01890 [Algoriphagus lacus]
MMYQKTTKFSSLLVGVGLLMAGCESTLVQEDLVNEIAVKEETSLGGFKLSELKEMTDFSNLRQGDFTGRFFITSKGPNLPANLARSIAAAGGEVVKSFPEIGVAIAVSRSDNFYSQAQLISGVESVTPDIILQYTKEPEFATEQISLDASELGKPDMGTAGAPFNYQDAFFDGFQWAPASIDAPTAWDAGFTGEGVRVAVIDGGFRNTHQDLVANFDVASSVSTVPGFNFNQDVGTFWHGTHVAGIVAAAGVGTVGIAPKATIIGVKSLHNGSGAFEWILEGILYAATPQSRGGAGAQIINMSLGAEIDFRTFWQEEGFREEFRELQKIYDRATLYAFQNGVTVIASSGNGASNFDEENNLYKLPAENRHVLSISSTGPTGWIFSGNTNFDQPSYFTDYGKSLVDFAAPGGSAGLLVVDGITSSCTLNGTYVSLLRPCYVFDMVLSPSRGAGSSNTSYSWAQGTSMASPAAAGVAALIIEANGGSLTPAQVKTKLLQSATDLGKPGQDLYYGNGYVNAAKAVGLN